MPSRALWRRLRIFLFRRVLHADDSPHRIALGASIGLFVAWTPTIGIQIVLAIAVAHLLRANKASTFPVIWVTNWFTAAPIYYFNWVVGHAIVRGRFEHSREIRRKMLDVFRNPQGELVIFDRLFDADFWQQIRSAMLHFGVDLWVGSLIVGMVLAVLLYLPSRWLVVAIRRRRAARRQLRRQRRQAQAAAESDPPS